MPRIAPPTPAPSNDISAKTHDTASFDASFILPPAALSSDSARGSSSSSSAASDSSYRPLSPTSPATSSKPPPAPAASSTVPRKRPAPSQSVITKDDYALPPPPTRSRKIIQMKPQGQDSSAASTAAKNTNAAAAGGGGAAGGKKKQASGATAAGRKIARKTAHSLIERRRRSKMNEEFGVLKDMIPACAGQEMHKLAILQASIDYMRYLEQCVVDLKASHRSRRPSPTPASPQHTPPLGLQRRAPSSSPSDDDEGDDDDEDMSDAVSPTHQHPPITHFPHNPPSSTTSPALYPASAHPSPALHPSDTRHYSLTTSPALQPSDPHHYSLTSSLRSTAASPSVQPSPVFSAQGGSHTQFRNPFTGAVVAPGSSSGGGAGAGGVFSLTSPALGPQPDREDHEATEALLMLNTDRRSWSGRGMSVRDLLSG